MSEVSFQVERDEWDLAHKIARRAVAEMNLRRPDMVTQIQMDIIATHANGCPLRLPDLLAADDFNFAHDVCGIRQHLDRETGRLTNCFVPRFAAPSYADA